jgi:hypothetical protein
MTIEKNQKTKIFTGFINEYVVKPVYTEPKVQGSHTIFNLNSRVFPGFFFSIFKIYFRKSLAVFLNLEWGLIHQISVFQRCYVLYSMINITVH